jgi:uncharacterized protein (TIGR02246 family)
MVAGLVMGCASGDDRLSEADVAAIRAIEQEFAQASIARDFDRVLAQRTDDIVWMPPNSPALVGKDAVRQALEANPPASGFVITSEQTEGSDDLAYDRGTYVYSVVVGTDTVNEGGKYLQILRRQPDGSWRLAVEIWNANQPPPPPAPAPARRRAQRSRSP